MLKHKWIAALLTLVMLTTSLPLTAAAETNARTEERFPPFSPLPFAEGEFAMQEELAADCTTYVHALFVPSDTEPGYYEYSSDWDLPDYNTTYWDGLIEMLTEIPPSCTEPGCVVYQCRICGTVFRVWDQPRAHTYQNGVCGVCGKIEPKPIDFTAEDVTVYEGTDDALDLYRAISSCGRFSVRFSDGTTEKTNYFFELTKLFGDPAVNALCSCPEPLAVGSYPCQLRAGSQTVSLTVHVEPYPIKRIEIDDITVEPGTGLGDYRPLDSYRIYLRDGTMIDTTQELWNGIEDSYSPYSEYNTWFSGTMALWPEGTNPDRADFRLFNADGSEYDFGEIELGQTYTVRWTCEALSGEFRILVAEDPNPVDFVEIDDIEFAPYTNGHWSVAEAYDDATESHYEVLQYKYSYLSKLHITVHYKDGTTKTVDGKPEYEMGLEASFHLQLYHDLGFTMEEFEKALNPYQRLRWVSLPPGQSQMIYLLIDGKHPLHSFDLPEPERDEFGNAIDPEYEEIYDRELNLWWQDPDNFRTVRFKITVLPDDSFHDVAENAFYAKPVKWAVENGITNGVNQWLFAPQQVCTRAQVATFLWRAAGSPEPTALSEANDASTPVILSEAKNLSATEEDSSVAALPQNDKNGGSAIGSPEPASLSEGGAERSEAEGVNPFTDIAEGSYCYKAVLWAVENGITNGMDVTHFGPNEFCTRGQVVTFLWRAKGSPEPIALSETNNASCPVILSEAKNLSAAEEDSSVAALPQNDRAGDGASDVPFEDVSESAYYYKAILWAVENGITNGVDETHFAPGNPCTRAQVVTFLYRAFHE